MSDFLIGFDKRTGLQNYWCEKGNETSDESYGFFKGKKSRGVGLYLAPDGFNPEGMCILNLETEEIHIASKKEIESIDKERKRQAVLAKVLLDLKKHKNRLIQTIPAHIRSAVLGSEKQNQKTYTDTWQNFYQRCQNVRFDPDILHEKQPREAATWVVSRIEKISNNARSIKKQIQAMSVEELELFKIEDPLLWENIK